MRNVLSRTILGVGFLIAAAAQAAPVQWTVANGGNGHYYEYLSYAGSVNSWSTARNAALTRTYLGMNGYLVTIGSAAENAFVSTLVSYSAWLGASDATTEGTWTWSDGPEAGQVMYSGGRPVTGVYSNWYSGEPNDYGRAEDYAVMYVGWNYRWNDVGITNPVVSGYIVEYGTGFGTAVPEPSSLALVGTAIAGLGWTRRRRKTA